MKKFAPGLGLELGEQALLRMVLLAEPRYSSSMDFYNGMCASSRAVFFYLLLREALPESES